MAHDVFISYSHKDQPIADGICAKLEADGLRCWIAPRDIGPGEDWPAAIATGIAGSKVMVLVFSQSSNMSEDVSRELYLAANHKVIIIPFVIEDVRPEAGKAYYLGRTHWLDAMNPPTNEQIGKLIERVRSLMKDEGKPEAAGGVARMLNLGQRIQRRRPWAIPAALLVLAALVAGVIFLIPKVIAGFPVGLSQPGSVDPSFYLYREDFNDPEFDGRLSSDWGAQGGCPNATMVQEQGALIFRTSADILPNCNAGGPGTWYTLDQVKALEFAIRISPELPVDSSSFGFFMNGASEPGQNGGLALNCALNGAQSGCMVGSESGPLYQTRRFTLIPGETYTFRIEILDPVLMSFRFLANNETIGEFTMDPSDAPLYKDFSFHVSGGLVQMGGRPRAGEYYLDYLAVEQR